MASFTSAGDTTSINMPDRGDAFTVALSGTYLMTIDLQREQGSPGSGSWVTVKQYTTENATVSDTFTTTDYNSNWRLIVQVDGGGTCTATLTNSLDMTISVIRDAVGNPLATFKQSGVTFPGAVNRGATSLTASVTLTSADAGKRYLLNAAAGLTVTMPAATGSGAIYEFVVGTLITSNAYIIASDSNGTIYGVICGADDPGDEFTWAAVAGTDDDVTLGGTNNATGGSLGDTVFFTDIATNKWAVRGFITQSGTEATPFS